MTKVGKRPRGICPLCGREVSVRVDGTPGAHNTKPLSGVGCRAARKTLIEGHGWGPLQVTKYLGPTFEQSQPDTFNDLGEHK